MAPDLSEESRDRDIRRMLLEAQSDLSFLDENIKQLQGVLDSLMKRRVQSVAQMDGLRARLAPHQKMPPEILAKIFTHCVNSEIVELRFPNKCSLPWTLGHICSRWRQIALAEPVLWRRIHARSYSPLQVSTVQFLHEIMSNRGGSGAIEFQISPVCSNDWTTLLNLFSTYPARLRTLRLTVNAWYSSMYLHHPLRIFDDLESLALNFSLPSYAIDDAEGAAVIKAFSAARRLRKVEIFREGSYNPNLLNMNSFPWAQLTSLTISCITTFAISRILCECRELSELVVGLQADDLDTPSALPAEIRLKHLQSINIQFGTTSNAVLDRLITPALKSLSFGRLASASQKCILDLLERSDCDLELLHYPGDETPDMISLLKATPHLRELSIRATDPVPQKALDAVQMRNLSPRLCVIKMPVSSIRSAVHFLQNRWRELPYGSYQGIRDAKFALMWEDFTPDQQWYEELEPELTRSGRRIELILI